MKPRNLFLRAALSALAAALLLVPAARAGDVSGTALYDGDNPPTRKVIKFDADPKCAALHTKKRGTENVIISKTKKIKNVFVYVKEISGDFPASTEAVIIDQKGCEYKPHVFGMQRTQALTIRNSDGFMHNIHFLGGDNREFNKGQPVAGDMEQKFRRVQIGGKFKCDVHPWMNAYVHILDHPFFAVSNSKGEFKIEGLPAGKYTLVAWHEELGTVEKEIEVGGDALEGVDFAFEGK